jgi:hypothetical protein
MMGCVAVIACYWTSATLLAHVPEAIVMHGGRTGWKKRCSFCTRTRASKSVGGIKTVFLFKNVQESNEFILRGIKIMVLDQKR